MSRTKKIIASVLIAASVSVVSIFSSFAFTPKADPGYTWELVEGKWTVSDSDGNAVKGWLEKDNNIYFLNYKGVMRTGWVKSTGNWYYLYTEDDVSKELIGTLAKDAWIDNYYVDENGVWTKTR